MSNREAWGWRNQERGYKLVGQVWLPCKTSTEFGSEVEGLICEWVRGKCNNVKISWTWWGGQSQEWKIREIWEAPGEDGAVKLRENSILRWELGCWVEWRKRRQIEVISDSFGRGKPKMRQKFLLFQLFLRQKWLIGVSVLQPTKWKVVCCHSMIQAFSRTIAGGHRWIHQAVVSNLFEWMHC